MSPLATLLRDVAATLWKADMGFALVGGLAVSVRTEPRFTRDVDLVVDVTGDRQAEAVSRLLVPPYEVLATLEHDELRRLAAVRFGWVGAAAAGAVVDLLFSSSGIEAEIVHAATPIAVFPQVSVPVAHTGHLLALKLLARDERRPQDDIDLRALLAVAKPSDLELTSQAIGLIVQRGANRGRDLGHEWQQLVPKRQ